MAPAAAGADVCGRTAARHVGGLSQGAFLVRFGERRAPRLAIMWPFTRGCRQQAGRMDGTAIQIRIIDERLGREIPLPDYATEGSAGMDLRACLTAPLTVEPGETVLIPTGMAMYCSPIHGGRRSPG